MCVGIAGLGQAETVEELTKKLKDENVNVRMEAVEALGIIGDLQTLDPLLFALKDKDSIVRTLSAMALVHMAEAMSGQMANQKTINALNEALNDSERNVKSCVLEIMEKIKDPRTVKPLLEALKKEKNSEIRMTIEEVLANMKNIKQPELEKFIAEREDVNWKSPSHGQTKLHETAGDGKNKEVRNLLSRAAEINARANDGSTPLHWAVGNDYNDTAELLLSEGADVNLKDMNGNTPLHGAVVSENREVVKILIAHGADLNAKNMIGLTPLGLAVQFELEDMADFLRKHGAKE